MSRMSLLARRINPSWERGFVDAEPRSSGQHRRGTAQIDVGWTHTTAVGRRRKVPSVVTALARTVGSCSPLRRTKWSALMPVGGSGQDGGSGRVLARVFGHVRPVAWSFGLGAHEVGSALGHANIGVPGATLIESGLLVRGSASGVGSSSATTRSYGLDSAPDLAVTQPMASVGGLLGSHVPCLTGNAEVAEACSFVRSVGGTGVQTSATKIGFVAALGSSCARSVAPLSWLSTRTSAVGSAPCNVHIVRRNGLAVLGNEEHVPPRCSPSGRSPTGTAGVVTSVSGVSPLRRGAWTTWYLSRPGARTLVRTWLLPIGLATPSVERDAYLPSCASSGRNDRVGRIANFKRVPVLPAALPSPAPPQDCSVSLP